MWGIWGPCTSLVPFEGFGADGYAVPNASEAPQRKKEAKKEGKKEIKKERKKTKRKSNSGTRARLGATGVRPAGMKEGAKRELQQSS